MSATESLIERLKAATMGFDWADLPDDAAIPAVPLLRQAAAELEALRSRCKRMEEALKPFGSACSKLFNDTCPDYTPAWWTESDDYETGASPVTVGDFRAAARALQQGGKAE